MGDGLAGSGDAVAEVPGVDDVGAGGDGAGEGDGGVDLDRVAAGVVGDGQPGDRLVGNVGGVHGAAGVGRRSVGCGGDGGSVGDAVAGVGRDGQHEEQVVLLAGLDHPCRRRDDRVVGVAHAVAVLVVIKGGGRGYPQRMAIGDRECVGDVARVDDVVGVSDRFARGALGLVVWADGDAGRGDCHFALTARCRVEAVVDRGRVDDVVAWRRAGRDRHDEGGLQVSGSGHDRSHVPDEVGSGTVVRAGAGDAARHVGDADRNAVGDRDAGSVGAAVVAVGDGISDGVAGECVGRAAHFFDHEVYRLDVHDVGVDQAAAGAGDSGEVGQGGVARQLLRQLDVETGCAGRAWRECSTRPAQVGDLGWVGGDCRSPGGAMVYGVFDGQARAGDGAGDVCGRLRDGVVDVDVVLGDSAVIGVVQCILDDVAGHGYGLIRCFLDGEVADGGGDYGGALRVGAVPVESGLVEYDGAVGQAGVDLHAESDGARFSRRHRAGGHAGPDGDDARVVDARVVAGAVSEGDPTAAGVDLHTARPVGSGCRDRVGDQDACGRCSAVVGVLDRVGDHFALAGVARPELGHFQVRGQYCDPGDVAVDQPGLLAVDPAQVFDHCAVGCVIVHRHGKCHRARLRRSHVGDGPTDGVGGADVDASAGGVGESDVSRKGVVDVGVGCGDAAAVSVGEGVGDGRADFGC